MAGVTLLPGFELPKAAKTAIYSVNTSVGIYVTITFKAEVT